jgi:hypothetical protein
LNRATLKKDLRPLLPLALGLAATAVFMGLPTALMAAVDRFVAPESRNNLLLAASVLFLPALPGAPLGLLSLSFHSTGFVVLTILGDIVFYTWIARKVILRRNAVPANQRLNVKDSPR